MDVLSDGIDIFHVLFYGVGVVETQVADAVILLRNAKVHADSLDVSDVQVAVRLGRETRLDATVIDSFFDVFFYDLLDKIERFLLYFVHMKWKIEN